MNLLHEGVDKMDLVVKVDYLIY